MTVREPAEITSMLVVTLITMLSLALLPAIMTALNLSVLHVPPGAPEGARVSFLIPARNEESGIAACVESALASSGVHLEVVVLDDHSTDATATIVGTIAARDSRVRLASAPPLPAGWSGKQHACHVLAGLGAHPTLVFVDADVRLAPEAAARLAGALAHTDLVSCVPLQRMGSLAELMLIPMINMLLLGYLPMSLMRRDSRPSLGAGCGQLIAVRADAYRRAGGHAAIRHSLHDGLLLPRQFRAVGLRTDLVAGSTLARCRMYVGWRATLAGSLKNATEGMARPLALPIWTVLLLGGHVLPWAALLLLLDGAHPIELAAAAIACVAPLVAHAAQAVRCREPLSAVLLHPFSVCLLVIVQWYALLRQLAGVPSTWRGRTYPARS